MLVFRANLGDVYLMKKAQFSSNSTYDFLIIGTGLAGLSCALKLAPYGKVALVAKSKLDDTNSWMAQGGIASVVYKKEDSFESHIQDTLVAGAGLCDRKVVEYTIKQGPKRIQDLVDWGVKFDKSKEDFFALTKEGGHSHHRILHVGDYTGRAINQTLLKNALEAKNIDLLENEMAVDLILKSKMANSASQDESCLGAFLLNKDKNEVNPILAKSTVLATGGAGKVYLYTSNWSGATGDGVAMAYRAGAKVSHLEFMQFHPTCLYHPEARNFLISEALRGEGAKLKLPNGHEFMRSYHPLADLAPRDIVARSIDSEMKKQAINCVYLDISFKSKAELELRFPSIYKKCAELGIFIDKEPIPVVPAAHYLCGGIDTDLNGQTNLPGLYAIGEVAHTGLHGGNRLASNSLLECLVFSHNTSQHIIKTQNERENFKSWPQWKYHELENQDELIVIKHMWEEIRQLMWNYVGIVRSNRRLERAQNRLNNIQNEISEYYSHFKIHPDIVELRNIALVAELTVKGALSRKRSQGIHYNIDYPVD